MKFTTYYGMKSMRTETLETSVVRISKNRLGGWDGDDRKDAYDFLLSILN